MIGTHSTCQSVRIVAAVVACCLSIVIVPEKQVQCVQQEVDVASSSLILDNQFFLRKIEELEQVQEGIDLLGDNSGNNDLHYVISVQLNKAKSVMLQLATITSTMANSVNNDNANNGDQQAARDCQASYQPIIGSSLLNLLTEFTWHNGELIVLQSKATKQYLLDQPMDLVMALAQFDQVQAKQRPIMSKYCHQFE